MSEKELTEEDVIRYLEECNESQDILGFCYIPEIVCSKILELYNKEKEQNRVSINSINDLMKECNQENKRCAELAIELDKEKEKNKELENADLTIVYMNGFYDGEKKWKNKINAMLEGITKEHSSILSNDKYSLNDKNIATFQYNAMKKILEELLQEGDK